MEIDYPALVTTLVTHFDVVWFLEGTKDNTFAFDPIKYCTWFKQLCLKVLCQRSRIKYIINGDLQPLIDSDRTYDKRITYSLTTANTTCTQDLGADLPFFKNRDELDEFTAMLQKSEYIPFIEAVFIGLKYNPLKVS